MAQDNPLVVDYAFTSVPFNIMAEEFVGSHQCPVIWNDAQSGKADLYQLRGVPQNYLNVLGTEFYLPESTVKVRKGVGNYTDSGVLDPVSLLFTDEWVNEYPAFNTTDSNDRNYKNMTMARNQTKLEGSTETLRMILPTGTATYLVLEAGSTAYF